ncbi:ECM331 [[Candida] subhashii]|uniref:ECM331 n=1 Tax=[Candida] subhashii TaxID=561895 RepID=A0A8J5QPI6_9ASCO|nr:ECM331 [[Candida] subhashii]KAG7664185.1 ECM331 [[Candida] subhashii]
MKLAPLLIGLITSLSLVHADDDDESSSTTATSNRNPCSFSRTTITQSTGVQEINSCATLDGDITISGSEIEILDLPGIRQLEGSLTVINSPTILNVNFLSLANITGALKMQNMTRLVNVQLPALNISKDLQLVSLPSLEVLGLNSEMYSIEKVVLSDTALSDINGFNGFENIHNMNINNNKNITRLNFGNLKTVTENLILSFNHDNAIVEMDELIWAANLTIQDVAGVSLKNLTNVNGSLSLSFNTFESLDLDSLTNVGTSLQIFANDDLTDLSVNNLTEISGEFKMFNNTALEDMNNTFTSLRRVRGAVSITGVFETLEMPSLERVDGDFMMTSTDEDFNCDAFDELHDRGDIQGHNYECAAQKSEAFSSDEVDSDDDSNGGSGGSGGSGSGNSSAGDKLFVPSVLLSIIVGILAINYV